MTANLSALTAESPTKSQEHPVIAANGEIKWQRWTNRAIFNKEGEFVVFHAIGEDITKRKMAEKRLAESQKLLGAVIEQSPIPMVIAMPSGEMTYNQACADQLRFEDEPTIKPGINLFDMKQPWKDYDTAGNLMPTEDLPLALALQGKTTKDLEIRVVRKDGSERWEIVNGAPIYDDEGKLIAGFVAFPDITKRKQMEEQLRQAHKMEAIGTLAGGIAHDFNNILGSILGFTELALEKTDESEKNHRYLSQVHVAALRAKGLVSQLLSFSRQSENIMKPIEVAPILIEAMKLIRSTVPANIQIETNINANDCLINANPTNLHQVIMNLCSNAASSMEDSDGCLEVTLDSYELEDRELQKLSLSPGTHVRLTVSDNGPGITSDNLARIFDPFLLPKISAREQASASLLSMGLSRTITELLRLKLT